VEISYTMASKVMSDDYGQFLPNSLKRLQGPNYIEHFFILNAVDVDHKSAPFIVNDFYNLVLLY
jgi:hypothetical protein